MLWRQDIDPQGGGFKVLLKKGEFSDSKRGGRLVPYKIYYPDMQDLEKVPVILWSHGFGGNCDGAEFLSRFLASNGYILVHMTHAGTDSSLWEGQKDRHPWDILKSISVTRETTIDRFKDVSFVLDCLEGWVSEGYDMASHMNMEVLGISGHSFGALTTQVMAGQLFPDENHKLVSYKEERFRAGIAYSPVPIRHLTAEAPEPHIYGPISIPMFFMTGTADQSPLEGFGYERRLVVYEYTGHPEKYLLVKEGGDHMVYNGTRGKLTPNPLREKHEEIVQIAALAFWDAYLKNDKKAKEWLTGGGCAAYIGTDGLYKAQTA